MYENGIPKMSIEETIGEAEFKFSDFQSKKRALSEESLKMSEKILDCLMGCRPTQTKEAANIDSFMADLVSEKETLCELHNNLSRILMLLGA